MTKYAVKQGVTGTEPKISDGFEDGDFTSNPEWVETDTDGSATVQSSVVKTGSNALEISVGASGSLREFVEHDRGAADRIRDGDVYSFFVYPDSDADDSSNSGAVIGLTNDSGDEAGADSIFVQEDDEFNLHTNDSTGSRINRQSITSNINGGQWFEIRLTINPSSNEVTAEVFDSNNNSLGSATNTTSGATNIRYIRAGTRAFNSGSIYYDDLSYSGAEQNSLDFGFTSDNSYTQGTGETLDLNVLEAIERTLSETVSVSESFQREADYFRNYNEVFGLDEADIKQFQRTLGEEVVTVQDTVSNRVAKSAVEQLSIDDVYSREASYERNLLEGFSLDAFTEITAVVNLFEDLTLNEADIRELQRTLSESFSVLDDYSRESSYFRSYSEDIVLNDAVEAIKVRFLTPTATLGVKDTTSQTAIVELFEDLTLNDVYNRKADLFRNYSEGIRFDERKTFSIRKQISEGFSTDAFTEIKAVINLFEDLTTNDVDSYTVGKALNEAFTVDESIVSRDVSIVKDERLRVDDSDVRDIRRTLLESFTGDDVYSREASFLRDFSEEVTVSDRDVVFSIGKVLDESLVLDEFRALNLSRTFDETVGLNAVFNREADLFRQVKEDITTDAVNIEVKDLFRSYDASIGFDEESRFTVSKVLNQSMAVDDSVFTEADLFRDYNEIISLNDVKRFTAGKNLDEAVGINEVFNRDADLFRQVKEAFSVSEAVSKKLSRTLSEAISLDDEFDFFFSEGPGTPPYFVRNSFVQGNSVQNEYVTKTLQNLFESLNVDNSFGDKEQT